MPSLPSIPLSEVSPIFLEDPVLKSAHQEYIYQVRTRNIRPKRGFVIQWKGLTASQKNTIERFIRELHGEVLTFDWVYPFEQTITNTTNTDPIVVTTQYHHNLFDLDKVVISGVVGTTAANGTHQAHVLTATTFELIDVAGDGAYVSGGVSQVYFPYLRLLFSEMTFSDTEKLLGPDLDDRGVYTVELKIQEEFF